MRQRRKQSGEDHHSRTPRIHDNPREYNEPAAAEYVGVSDVTFRTNQRKVWSVLDGGKLKYRWRKCRNKRGHRHIEKVYSKSELDRLRSAYETRAKSVKYDPSLRTVHERAEKGQPGLNKFEAAEMIGQTVAQYQHLRKKALAAGDIDPPVGRPYRIQQHTSITKGSVYHRTILMETQTKSEVELIRREGQPGNHTGSDGKTRVNRTQAKELLKIDAHILDQLESEGSIEFRHSISPVTGRHERTTYLIQLRSALNGLKARREAQRQRRKLKPKYVDDQGAWMWWERAHKASEFPLSKTLFWMILDDKSIQSRLLGREVRSKLIKGWLYDNLEVRYVHFDDIDDLKKVFRKLSKQVVAKLVWEATDSDGSIESTGKHPHGKPGRKKTDERDIQLAKWWLHEGSETYHKPAKCRDKWNIENPKSKFNPFTKDNALSTVNKAIERGRKALTETME